MIDFIIIRSCVRLVDERIKTSHLPASNNVINGSDDTERVRPVRMSRSGQRNVRVQDVKRI